MSATMTAPPVTVRRLPVPANSHHGNGPERPKFAACDEPMGNSINLPSTPNEWLAVHPDGFWQLGAVLRPVSGIVRGLAEREGLDYAEAVQSLIADHFVLRYEDRTEYEYEIRDEHGNKIGTYKAFTGFLATLADVRDQYGKGATIKETGKRILPGYVAKYDASKGLDFFAYCKVRFVYLVREAHAHRSAHLRTTKARTTTPGTLPTVDTGDKALQVVDCQTCKAVALEERQAELQALADVCEKLKSLDSTASFVLWNHTGLGRTYDDLGQYLGMAPKSVKQVHIGAVASMRRMLGVRAG